MRLIRQLTLVGCLLAFSLLAHAQRITGGSGLLKIPGGDLFPDKTVSIGMNYLPQGVDQYRINYNTANYFVTISFLPFLEGTYHLTLTKNEESRKFTEQDRSFSFKIRLLKESNHLPSLIFGMIDFYSHVPGSPAQTFASLYLASDKTLKANGHQLKITAGYGFEFKGKTQLEGIFCGIRYIPKNLSWLELLAEYDSQNFNFASSVLLWNHLSLYAGWYGIQKPAAGLSYRFRLG